MEKERERKKKGGGGGGREGWRKQGVRRGEEVWWEERRDEEGGDQRKTIEMEGRKIGNCGVKDTERRKESSGCDGEKTEERRGGFVRGARQCKWPVSGSGRAARRPLLISRGQQDGKI